MDMESTADLCDRLGAAAQVCAAPWRSYGGRTAAAGPIATVQADADAGLVRQQLGTPGAGRVLVVDAGGALLHAMLGERLARLGLAQGWAGVLVHGAIRDAQALQALDFAVFALGSVPARAGLQSTGRCGGALHLGGAHLQPGQWIAMDADGVVVAPR